MISLLMATTAVFTAINNERPVPLAWNTDIAVVAQAKADEMAEIGYFSHRSPTGLSVLSILYNELGFRFRGENLAVTHIDNIGWAIPAWVASPKHLFVLSHDGFSDTGIGIARGRRFGAEVAYIVQLFGGKKK